MSSLQLSLIRHAKAGFPLDPAGGDHDRVLTKTGEEDAVAMATVLGAASFEPDLVWTSTARRAMATCHFFAQTMGWPSSVLTARDDLYLAEPFDLLRWVRGCHDDVQHLAVVGHNPGLEALWAWLCRSEAQGLPPCGVVLIRLKVKTWLEVDEGTGDLLDFILPQSLAERRS